MKKRAVGFLLAIFTIGASVASAAPEHITIKNSDKAAKERIAKTQIKNINLQDIEDPAARKAIQEIVNYLDLQSQK